MLARREKEKGKAVKNNVNPVCRKHLHFFLRLHPISLLSFFSFPSFSLQPACSSFWIKSAAKSSWCNVPWNNIWRRNDTCSRDSTSFRTRIYSRSWPTRGNRNWYRCTSRNCSRILNSLVWARWVHEFLILIKLQERKRKIVKESMIRNWFLESVDNTNDPYFVDSKWF